MYELLSLTYFLSDPSPLTYLKIGTNRKSCSKFRNFVNNIGIIKLSLSGEVTQPNSPDDEIETSQTGQKRVITSSTCCSDIRDPSEFGQLSLGIESQWSRFRKDVKAKMIFDGDPSPPYPTLF